MIKQSILALYSFLVIMMVSLSTSSFALSLEEAWKGAEVTDPSYQKSLLGVKRGEVVVQQYQSNLLPNVQVSASENWSESGGDSNRYGISLSQNIWDSNLWSELDHAKAQYLQSKLELVQAQNNLALKVIQAYLDVASAQSSLELAKTKLRDGKKLHEIIKARFLAGKIKSVDVEESNATLLASQNNVLTAEADLIIKHTELSSLMNQDFEKVNLIRTNIDKPPAMMVEKQEAWLKLAKDNSPELLVAIQKVKASKIAKESAESGYYPKVTGNLGYNDSALQDHGELNAGVSLNLPLDLNGSMAARVDEASLNLLIAKQSLREVEINIKKRVMQAYSQVGLNWSQVLVAYELVKSREKVLNSKNTLYKAGRLELSDVINAHDRFYEAKNSLQINLNRYWRERVNLLNTVGKLDEQAIQLLTMAFQ
ncbi:hypothetical protein BS333_17795 [Vibrio azureus]|uniref:Outer membrane protein TolC n=1 Tax=Vibrio azureus NBRC 104587 TaxID=1219077 RepID=U3C9G6_9VIBR|nr:TolC family protein [Vibrio azureus]AUI88208.1 hypothetical protein BS333_17795 [Vibrio azureus]GAD78004.1 hypothetical protein VAZ01S_108_00060 [Vibrio azureus NBRC 104587]